MTVVSRIKGAGALLLAGGLVLVGLQLWTPGNEEDGGVDVVGRSARPVPRKTPCFRFVTFSANWADKGVQARRVEWGPAAITTTWWNVRAPFSQRDERVACGSLVRIEVTFPDNVQPGKVLCAITVSVGTQNRVYEPLDPERTFPRCVVEERIP